VVFPAPPFWLMIAIFFMLSPCPHGGMWTCLHGNMPSPPHAYIPMLKKPLTAKIGKPLFDAPCGNLAPLALVADAAAPLDVA